MDLGTYQNYNQNLPNLQLYRYENIFKTYQTQDANKDFFYNIINIYNYFIPKYEQVKLDRISDTISTDN